MRSLAVRLTGVLVVMAGVNAYADGTVFVDFRGANVDRPGSIRVGPDGRILVEDRPEVGRCTGFFAFDSNGTLIPNFGSRGRLATNDECAVDYAFLPDSSVAMIYGSGSARELRFRDATGALTSTVPITPGMDHLARLPDGRFMLGGSRSACYSCDIEWQIARLNADGTPDLSFGGGLLVPPVISYDVSMLSSFGLLPNGRLQTAGLIGTFGPSDPARPLLLARFNSTGSDASFGLNGLLTATRDRDSSFTPGMLIDSRGRTYFYESDGRVMRLNADGVRDTAYVGSPTRSLSWVSAALDPLDRLVIFARIAGTEFTDVAYIARFDETGAPDPIFNRTGELLFQFPSHGLASASPLPPCIGTVDAQQRPLVACGVVDEVSQGDLGLARFTPSGELDLTFGAAQPDSDTYPDPVIFADVSVPYGTALVPSGPATIRGLGVDDTVDVRIGGDGDPAISVGCTGTFAVSATLKNGDVICLRVNASPAPLGTATATVNIGGRLATFTVLSTEVAADVVPDPFVLLEQTGVPLNTVVQSNTITVTGITGFATATVTGGGFSIDCSPWTLTSSNRIRNGMQLCVHQTTASTVNTTKETVLTIGGVSATFRTTTGGPDTSPDPFAFERVVTSTNTITDSNRITVTGINVATPISVTGSGSYCIVECTTSPGTVTNGTVVYLTQISSSRPGVTTSTTLTIGDRSATFSVTTEGTSGGRSRRGGGGSLDLATLALLGLALGVAHRRRARRRFPARQLAAGRSQIR